jgi:hypothetical protein
MRRPANAMITFHQPFSKPAPVRLAMFMSGAARTFKQYHQARMEASDIAAVRPSCR